MGGNENTVFLAYFPQIAYAVRFFWAAGQLVCNHDHYSARLEQILIDRLLDCNPLCMGRAILNELSGKGPQLFAIDLKHSDPRECAIRILCQSFFYYESFFDVRLHLFP